MERGAGLYAGEAHGVEPWCPEGQRVLTPASRMSRASGRTIFVALPPASAKPIHVPSPRYPRLMAIIHCMTHTTGSAWAALPVSLRQSWLGCNLG
jgi:hypothetical protein